MPIWSRMPTVDYPTEIHIINLSDEMLHVAGTLYSNAGTELGYANIFLAAAPWIRGHGVSWLPSLVAGSPARAWP